MRFKEFIKPAIFPTFLFFLIAFFYFPALFQGKIAAPADTIVGLYHPFRDFYAKDYPRGIPFKNFLITDPVRQTYVWKELSVDIYKNFEIPAWNPYEMAGKPLVGNFQSGAFYPLNLLLFLMPFSVSWNVFIGVQSILIGFFMYLYLKNLRLSKVSSLLGALSLTFSSFVVVWLEWGNVVHTLLWLPLILLATDKILAHFDNKGKNLLVWSCVYVASFLFSFFAGHLQTFVYLYATAILYIAVRFRGIKINSALYFIFLNMVFLFVSFIQWYPTLQFILLSARSIDQNYLTIEGWFIPVKQLIQFIAPDFFGNPTTLNYWGVWNYAELGGYIGVLSLMLVPLAFFRRRKISFFFLLIIVVGLLFSVDNPIARIPYQLNIPFLSTTQPTRLLSIIIFSLTVLSAFGMEYVLKNSKKRILTLFPLAIFIVIVLLLWIGVMVKSPLLFGSLDVVAVSKRNLMLPTALLGSGVILITGLFLLKNRQIKNVLIFGIFVLLSFDLLRYAGKFTPFTSSAYLYPSTRIVNYLKKDTSVFRVGATDQRVMAPNFFTHYRIQTVEGYDPLYLKSYAEFIAALERGNPDIDGPLGFNRIITPHNVNSPLMDFLNVKYVLSFDELSKDKFEKIMEEGVTKLYRNKKVIPRAFFVNEVVLGKNDNDVIQLIYKNNLENTAVLFENSRPENAKFSKGAATIKRYSENNIIIKTQSGEEGFLVLTDAFYPTWKATIDGVKTQIYKTDFTFRGIVVPKGEHTVEFSVGLF